MLSIVIPTFNERENVEIISKRISETLKSFPYEILFVDDSIDDTPDFLEKVSKRDSRVKYIHREVRGNLATAVVLGIEKSTGEFIVVMDADLQHPPEYIPKMIVAMKDNVDIVIPSRFVPGGDDGGLKGIRKFMSWFARISGQIVLSDLRKVTDPTGGFFMFRRRVVEGVELKPVGWKIMIEILVRGNYDKIVEIPYAFSPREHGDSKFSFKEQINYGLHLLRLFFDSPKDRRFLLFAIVGTLGVFVNLVFYTVLFNFLGIQPWISSAVAGTLTILFNFTLNKLFTWSDRKGHSVLENIIKYFIVSIFGIVINTLVVILICNIIYSGEIIPPIAYIAQILGIGLATAWNYIMNNKWTFNEKNKE
ncbi:MAG: glycosyltransferase family 2 protein [Methanosarcinaceae archaeon]|nr:glycosyltransferase family 2 protein [Methanosarcinaceae archaeon]